MVMTDSHQIRLAIAEKLGWKNVKESAHKYHPIKYYGDHHIYGRTALPDWFNDISAAMGLLEKYDEVDLWKDADGWKAQIVCNETGGFYSFDKSLPRAITLACAKAMGIEVNEEG